MNPHTNPADIQRGSAELPEQGHDVIELTRLNGKPLAVNSDLIKFVEQAPDTVITLVTGEKIVVRECADEVVKRIIQFRRLLVADLQRLPSVADSNSSDTESNS